MVVGQLGLISAHVQWAVVQGLSTALEYVTILNQPMVVKNARGTVSTEHNVIYHLVQVKYHALACIS